MRFRWTGAVLLALPACAQTEFFETKIRPVLATKCYGCHSTKLKSPMGGLALDTREGTHHAVEGKLLAALRYSNPNLQMPPGGKLPDAVIADFEQWIADGAKDPREDAPAAEAKPAGINFAKGRTWWAFQPVKEMTAPNTAWARRKIDGFILGELEKNNLSPSPEADARTLIRRATLDLVGIAPRYADVEAFTIDSYEHLIDRLLDSPQYGERWGRYWLDVARWAEDNPTGEGHQSGVSPGVALSRLGNRVVQSRPAV
jgi:hypothetical protein